MSRYEEIQTDQSYGLWQIRVENCEYNAYPSRVVWLEPGERVIPTTRREESLADTEAELDDERVIPMSDHNYSILQPDPRWRGKPYQRLKREHWRKRERWWHSWEAFRRYHKSMYVAMRNEKHYDCVPLMDLREAVKLREPSWREQHWRGLYLTKWVGGGFLLVELLRV